MKILVNASNLKIGGGVQVADSVCRELYKYPQHHFWVVYDKSLEECAQAVKQYANVDAVEFETPIDKRTVLTGRCKFLDDFVVVNKIDAVLTIFGPSRWIPKVPHLSGFAYPHLVFPESPYCGSLTFVKRVRVKWKKRSFAKCSDNYYTENPLVSERLQKLFPKKKVFTVTNNANQVFLSPENWDKSIVLPQFKGLTLLTVSANYPHKNLPIIVPASHYLEDHFPELNFRFVLTVHEKDMQDLDDCALRHIVFLGPVKIQQVPFLYEQSDVMFLPTLLECFSASYAEAMVMRRPILTTDLVFARGLCGKAALYYDATSPEELGKSIVKLSEDIDLRKQLVKEGDEQIKTFDTFTQRAEKLIKIIETIA